MAKQMKANRSLVGRSIVLLLVGSLLIPAAYARRLGAQTTAQTKASQSSKTAAVTEALKTSFGSSLDAVTAFDPFYLTGDFNGDGAQDIMVVVRIKGRRSDLPPDVKVVNPFYRVAGPAYPADAAAKPTLAFAIIHGTKAGWKNAQTAGKFLLVGVSPILILENDRATSGRLEDAKKLMEKRANSESAVAQPGLRWRRKAIRFS